VALETVRIDGDRILDWPSFHAVFAEAFGFPSFYGRNMDAWVDCMTCLDEPESGMTTVQVRGGTVLSLIIENAPDLKKRCPNQFEALVECAAFVNWRRIENGDQPVLALSFYA
jgi:hypothetical protein